MTGTSVTPRIFAVGLALAVLLGQWVSARPAMAQSQAVAEGLRLLEDWQLEDALELAEELLHETPDSPEAWMLAGRVLHQQGQHVEALRLLDAAADAGVETGYAHDLARGSADYAAHFQSYDSEHFIIRYLNKDEIVAHYAAPVLEAAYQNIGEALEFLPAERGEKIVVEIYPDARGLAAATGLTVQEIATSGTIAVCKFHRLMITSPLATADGYSWADTLAHEFVHLVISKKSRNSIPIWLHEGIAKFYESLWRGDAGMALSSYSENILAEAVRKREFITYDQMHPSMAKLPSQKDAALAFAEVFTTIEFLRKRYGPHSIPQVLELTRDGHSLERALKQVFKMSLDSIEASWRRYLNQRDFKLVPGATPQKIVLATEQEANKEKPLESMEDRQVHDFARLGELLQLRGNHHAAVVEYEKAYKKAGLQYITLIYRLARAYVQTDRVSDALSLLEEALRLHPDSGDAHVLAGRLRFERKELGAAERHFEAVRLQNPFNPEIHAAMTKLHELRGQTTEAQRTRRFLELASKPRPTRDYRLPPAPKANARVSIVPPHFGEVRLGASEPQYAPLWDFPIAAGEHLVEYRDKQGNLKSKSFRTRVGEDNLVVLD